MCGGGAPVIFSAAPASLAGLKSSSAPNLKKAASSSLPNICTIARLHADYLEIYMQIYMRIT